MAPNYGIIGSQGTDWSRVFFFDYAYKQNSSYLAAISVNNRKGKGDFKYMMNPIHFKTLSQFCSRCQDPIAVEPHFLIMF